MKNMENTRNVVEQMALKFDARYVDALRSGLGDERLVNITAALSRWTPPEASEREEIIHNLTSCGIDFMHACAIISAVLEHSRKANISCWTRVRVERAHHRFASERKRTLTEFKQPPSPTGVLSPVEFS